MESVDVCSGEGQGIIDGEEFYLLLSGGVVSPKVSVERLGSWLEERTTMSCHEMGKDPLVIMPVTRDIVKMMVGRKELRFHIPTLLNRLRR